MKMERQSETIKLTAELISKPSLTPNDSGCQEIIGNRLKSLGFTVENLLFSDVQNLWAKHGTVSPLLVLVGHTDVVPTGPEIEWDAPPFQPTFKNGLLYGRGAADMKSGLAAMITATERFLKSYPQHKGSIGFFITSDEEGEAINGTVKVVELLKSRNEKIDWCLVGEPSSIDTVGDTIKIGRRGSLTGKLTIHGKQGHVAYPQLAANPIHLATPAITELCLQEWDKGNDHFPPTTLQFSNIHAGTGADNVIPGTLDAIFNLRFSPVVTPDELKRKIESILQKHGLRYEIKWKISGMPFLTEAGKLINAVVDAVREITGIEAALSTAGGTSDGRFIAPTGAQVVELGVVNATIHKINECVRVTDIDVLSSIYELILKKLLA